MTPEELTALLDMIYARISAGRARQLAKLVAEDICDDELANVAAVWLLTRAIKHIRQEERSDDSR